jgi:hypothetical protein
VKRTYTADDLFIGKYPTGLVYANKRVEVAGDYKRLAYLNYRTLALEVDKGCPKEFLALIQADHARMLALKHTLYSIAGNMQIVLGDADLTRAQRDEIYVTGAVYGHPDSACAGTSASRDYLRTKCKRVSESKAREVHPNLFRYLDGGGQ